MRVGLSAFACALLGAGCVMSGYDRGPLPGEVSPPRAGADADGGKAGSSGEGGAGSSAVGAAGKSGSSGPKPAPVCETAKDGAACDDGLACTANDRCTGGRCEGKAIVCPPPPLGTELNNDCRMRACTEPSGECSDVPVPDLTGCGLGADVANCVAGQCKKAEECEDTICNPICTEPTCLFTCPEALLCQPSCIGGDQGPSVCYFDCRGAEVCEAGCANDSWCTIDCRDVEDCNGTCRIGTTCVFNCTDTPECDDIICEAGATCSAHCTPGQRCAFALCENGEMSCGENRIGCGGCPE